MKRWINTIEPLFIFVGFVVVLFSFSLSSCKEEKPATPQEQIAGRAAVQYYGYLQHRDFPAFVDGTYFGKPIPKEYRALLEKNAENFVHDQDSLRRGIKSVKFSRANLMNDTTLAAVYLNISFGDSTTEEVLVPMIKRKDVWYMK